MQATKFLNKLPQQVPNLSQGDSSSLSWKFDPNWRLNDEKSDVVGDMVAESYATKETWDLNHVHPISSQETCTVLVKRVII